MQPNAQSPRQRLAANFDKQIATRQQTSAQPQQQKKTSGAEARGGSAKQRLASAINRQIA